MLMIGPFSSYSQYGYQSASHHVNISGKKRGKGKGQESHSVLSQPFYKLSQKTHPVTYADISLASECHMTSPSYR